ncbi:MAG TPA: hypothetical protein VGS12_17175 [Caulobacteraceae bacterium]|nr:hypothetical protein [Caulobacteraceae bacterium]
MGDLDQEMGNASFPDAKTRKQAEEAKLQQIIASEELADAARKEHLDKLPGVATEKEILDRNLLAQAWVQKVQQSVPTPTPAEATAYMSEHPDMFAQRKIWSADMLQFPIAAMVNDPSLKAAMVPVHTIQDMQTLLDTRHIQYQRQAGQLDAARLDPRMVDAILKTPNDIIAFQAGDAMTAIQVTGSTVQPFTGDEAVKHAQALLQQQNILKAVNDGLRQVKAKADVQINKDYQPEPAAAGASSAPASNGQS